MKFTKNEILGQLHFGAAMQSRQSKKKGYIIHIAKCIKFNIIYYVIYANTQIHTYTLALRYFFETLIPLTQIVNKINEF